MDTGFFQWLLKFMVEHPTFIPLIISLLGNALFIYAIKYLYTSNVQAQKESNTAIGKLAELVNTMNTLLNLMVAGRKR